MNFFALKNIAEKYEFPTVTFFIKDYELFAHGVEVFAPAVQNDHLIHDFFEELRQWFFLKEIFGLLLLEENFHVFGVKISGDEDNAFF